MNTNTPRRALASTALIAALAIAGCTGTQVAAPTAAPTGQTSSGSPAPATAGSPTATCDTALVEQTQGPYFLAGSPERTNLREAGTSGTPLTLTGVVYDADCTPVPGAVVDFWQADGQGVYDKTGYALRGHQVTDGTGMYSLESVIPGQYPGRTEHIHVKITTPDGKTYTTQLYFPGAAANDEDGIYVPSMEIAVLTDTAQKMTAAFDFVLPA